MKIAIISNVHGSSWAGSEEVWFRMSLLALDAGHQVIASLHRDLHVADTLDLFRSKEGQIVEWRRAPVEKLKNLQQKLWSNFTDRRLCNPDIVMLSCGSLPGITHVPGLMQYLKKTRARIAVLCLFNAESLTISQQERTDVAWLLKNADVCAFVADQNRTLAVRQFGVNLDSASVFYGPLRQRFDTPIPMPGDNDEVIFSCVARMDILWKGQDILLEVLNSEIWKSRKWRLCLYGMGEDTDHVANLVKMYGLEERVSFEGYVKEMRDIWKKSQVMVLPSRGEGTPLATLEAMMCGRPVVTTDVGGNREVIEDGVSGWIAEAATPYSFSKTLERVWKDKNRWAEMGATAHKKALDLANINPSQLLLNELLAR